MDLKRYLLIGAIAVLSFMLLTEWVNFRQLRSEQAQQLATNGNATAVDSSNNIPQNLPTVSTDTVVTEDLPEMPAPAMTAEQTADTIASPTSVNSIRVVTDSLNVVIDMRGGDIVYAALPKLFAKINDPDQPFVLLEQNPYRTYIAQSGLIGRDGVDTAKGRPLYTASQTEYVLAEGEDTLTVNLVTTTENNVTITKQFRFQRDSYLIDVDYLIDNNSGSEWQAGLFGQLKRDGTPDPSADSSGFGMMPYLGAATSTVDEPYRKIKFDAIAEKNYSHSREGGWIAMIQHYFVSAWIPQADMTHKYSTVFTRDNMHIIRFTTPAITVAAGDTGQIKAQLYAGPKDQYTLETISPGLELTVDYGWLWWIAQPLFWLLTKIHGLVGNWGFAIIGITLLVKIVFFQLNATSLQIHGQHAQGATEAGRNPGTLCR